MKTTKIRVETIYNSFATQELKSKINEDLEVEDPEDAKAIIKSLGKDIGDSIKRVDV